LVDGGLADCGAVRVDEGCAAGVQEQVIDVGDAAGGGELQREQGQDPADRRDRGGAGVAGLADQGGQVEGDQVGNDQQQAGEPGVGAGREGAEVDEAGAGQRGLSAGGARRGALLRLRAAKQPAGSFLGEDLADAGAVQRGSRGGQPGADLIDRQTLSRSNIGSAW
jgi:hypothetical protein